MDKMLEIKQARRNERALLPYEEKIALVEKMRDRSLLLASNPLRQPVVMKSITFFVDGQALPLSDGPTEVQTPLELRQSTVQTCIPQNSVVVFVELPQQYGQSLAKYPTQLQWAFESPMEAGAICRRRH